MKKFYSYLALTILYLAGTVHGQTVIPASFDSSMDFWSGVANADWSAQKQAYASNAGMAPGATEAIYHNEFDWIGMFMKFDLSGVTPATVNADGFQALLDVMFHGFVADFNRYPDNPDPSPTPGAGDGFVYLDVYRIADSYANSANRWMKNSTSGSFLNWNNTVPTTLDEATAIGSNFNDTGGQLPLVAEDQTVLVAPQLIAANLAASARIQFAPAGAPVHLGGSGALWSGAPGNNMDDVGNTIVGDGPSNQNFGIVLAFDLPATAREKVLAGGTVTLNGETMLTGTIGNIDWANLIVTVQAVGNSVHGTLGDSGPGFITQAAANLAAADFDGVYDGAGPGDDATAAYTIATANMGAHFDGNPTTTDKVKFSVNLTSALASLPLSAAADRLMIGIWARVDGTGSEGTGLSGYVATNGDGVGDRVAFKSSTFRLRVLPPYALETVPNTYGELVWDVTQLVRDWVNGVTPNNGLFVHVNKEKSWGEQVNLLTMEEDNRPPTVTAPGDAAPLLRMGTAPQAPVIQGVITDPNFVVTCSSQVGYYYQLQYSTDLVNWVNATVEGLKEGTGDTLTFSRAAPSGAGAKVFYRVKASLAP